MEAEGQSSSDRQGLGFFTRLKKTIIHVVCDISGTPLLSGSVHVPFMA